jgi:hypothetical protein
MSPQLKGVAAAGVEVAAGAEQLQAAGVEVAAGAEQPPAVALEVAAGVPLSWAEEAVEAEEHP